MHEKTRQRLEAAGVDESAMKSHAVFGEEGSLMVFDIWESEEAWNTFSPNSSPFFKSSGLNRTPHQTSCRLWRSCHNCGRSSIPWRLHSHLTSVVVDVVDLGS
jgi:hypothetical protein